MYLKVHLLLMRYPTIYCVVFFFFLKWLMHVHCHNPLSRIYEPKKKKKQKKIQTMNVGCYIVDSFHPNPHDESVLFYNNEYLRAKTKYGIPKQITNRARGLHITTLIYYRCSTPLTIWYLHLGAFVRIGLFCTEDQVSMNFLAGNLIGLVGPKSLKLRRSDTFILQACSIYH